MGQHVNEGYYATYSYHPVKEALHTEFQNSATTLSDSSILWLVRKFEEAGSIQDKLRKGRLHSDDYRACQGSMRIGCTESTNIDSSTRCSC